MTWFTVIGIIFLIWGFYDLFLRKVVSYSQNKKLKNDWTYPFTQYYYPAEILSIGILLTVVGVATYLLGNNAEVVMSWILFGFGTFFLVLGLAVYYSKRIQEIFWKTVPKNFENESDRGWMAASLLLVSFSNFFGFFLFYPPFLGIG